MTRHLTVSQKKPSDTKKSRKHSSEKLKKLKIEEKIRLLEAKHKKGGILLVTKQN